MFMLPIICLFDACSEIRMLIRIKGVTLRDKVKSVDIRKELGVSSIQEKVREEKCD